MYNISRHRKDRNGRKILAVNMKWVDVNDAIDFKEFTDEEATSFIRGKGMQKTYYYFKTVKLK